MGRALLLGRNWSPHSRRDLRRSLELPDGVGHQLKPPRRCMEALSLGSVRGGRLVCFLAKFGLNR